MIAFALAIDALAASRSLLSSSSIAFSKCASTISESSDSACSTAFSAPGRIHVEERLRHPHEGRNPLSVDRQRILERFGGLGVVVHVQEQLAPAGVQGRIVGRLLGRDAIGVVGELKFTKRAGRAPQTRVFGRRRARAGLDVGHALQQRQRLVAAPHHVVKQAKLERCFAIGRAGGKRLQQRFTFGVLAAIDGAAAP